MQKIRCSLAAIALLATLLVSGLSLQGLGSVANAASNHYASSVSSAPAVGMLTRPGIKPPCPSGATTDC